MHGRGVGPEAFYHLKHPAITAVLADDDPLAWAFEPRQEGCQGSFQMVEAGAARQSDSVGFNRAGVSPAGAST